MMYKQIKKNDNLYARLLPFFRFYSRIKFYVGYIPFLLVKRKGKLNNLYFATTQKSGSQWLKAIFDDPRIKKYTKLYTYPQHNYDGDEFHKRFPKYTFVPGIYFAYPIFQKFVKKPKNYKIIYVIRDPRNIVVSWYYSVSKTHRALPGIIKTRKILNGMDKEEGITFAIKYLGNKFSEMRSWIDLAKDNEDIIILKFEDLISDSRDNLLKIFKFLNISIPEEVVIEVLKDYTKEKLRSKDIKNKPTTESHYRKVSSNHLDVFNEDHYTLFNNINGNLLEIMEYK